MSLLLGYNTNGFSHHRLRDALDVLAGIGYRAVGLTLDVHHAPPGSTDYEALGRELEERGLLPVVETGARYILNSRRKHFPSLLSTEGRDVRCAFYEDCIEAAAALGAPCVSLWSGREEGGESWTWLLDGLERVCDAADRHGIDVAFEPEPGMFVDRMAVWDELCSRLSHPRLRLTLDVGHLHCLENGTPAEWIRRYEGALVNVHLDDHRRDVHDHLFFGEGEIDFESVAAALLKVAAERTLPATVELSRHSHDAVETARRAYAFLAPLFESA